MRWVKGSDRNFKANDEHESLYCMTQTERQRKTEENVDMCPVVAPRYESGREREKVGFIENTAMRHRWGG